MDPDSPAGWALFAFKVFCATVIAIATLFTVYTVGPAVETRYFPAVSKLRILTIHPDVDGNSVITAEFTKLRGECEFIGLSWFRGKPDGEFERVPVILMRREGDDSSPNRPEGTQRAGPWIIGVHPSEIVGNSFARLSHRCHSFWTTTTDFWP